jgi:hypothetical protein
LCYTRYFFTASRFEKNENLKPFFKFSFFVFFVFTTVFVFFVTNMSGKGYASIPENGEGSSHDPLLSTAKKQPNLKDRLKQAELFVHRNFLHILTLVTIAIILIVLAIYTFVPETSILPNERSPRTVKAGVSELTMEAGRGKCEAIKSRPREKNLPNAKRATNPRAEPGQKPILIKNAIVWDGQGEVLNNVDIYIRDGTIRQVEKDIKLEQSVLENVKVIDAAGHVVGPGLVDMHR